MEIDGYDDLLDSDMKDSDENKQDEENVDQKQDNNSLPSQEILLYEPGGASSSLTEDSLNQKLENCRNKQLGDAPTEIDVDDDFLDFDMKDSEENKQNEENVPKHDQQYDKTGFPSQEMLCDQGGAGSSLTENSLNQKLQDRKSNKNVEATTPINTLPHGLFRLVVVGSEEQNLQIVAKLVMERQQIHRISNYAACNSSKRNGSQIDFEALNNVAIKPVGMLGTQSAIGQYFEKHVGISAAFFKTLKEGIYYYDVDKIPYVFIWPKPSFLEKPSRSSAYTSLLRYVIELCSHVVHLIDACDVEQFKPKLCSSSKKAKKGGMTFKIQKQTDQEADVKISGGAFNDTHRIQPPKKNCKLLDTYVEKSSNMAVNISKWKFPQEIKQKSETFTWSAAEVADKFLLLSNDFNLQLDNNLFTPLQSEKVCGASMSGIYWLINNLAPEMGEELKQILFEAGEMEQQCQAKLTNADNDLKHQDEIQYFEYGELTKKFFNLFLDEQVDIQGAGKQRYKEILQEIKKLFPTTELHTVTLPQMEGVVNLMVSSKAIAMVLVQDNPESLKYKFKDIDIKALQVKIFKEHYPKVNIEHNVLQEFLKTRTQGGWFGSQSLLIGDKPEKEFWESVETRSDEYKIDITVEPSQVYSIKQDVREVLSEHSAGKFKEKYSNSFRNRLQKYKQDCQKPILQTSPIREQISNWINSVQEQIQADVQSKLKCVIKKITLQSMYGSSSAKIVVTQDFEQSGDIQYVIRPFQSVKNSNADGTCAVSDTIKLQFDRNMKCLLAAPITDGSMKFLYVLASDDNCEVHVVNKVNGFQTSGSSKKKDLKVQIEQASFDPQRRMLCLFRNIEKVATVYIFKDKEYSSLDTVKSIPFGSANMVDLQRICLIPSTKELLVFTPSSISMVELQTSTFQHGQLKEENLLENSHFVPTPDGSLLVSLQYANDEWIYRVYSLRWQGSQPPFTQLRAPTSIQDFQRFPSKGTSFWIIEIAFQSFLVACFEDGVNIIVRAVKLTITSLSQRNVLTQKTSKTSGVENLGSEPAFASACNSIMDYLFYIFDKFPTLSVLTESTYANNWTAMIETSKGNKGDGIASDVQEYMKQVWSNLRTKTGKEFKGVEFCCQTELGWKLLSQTQILHQVKDQMMGDFITKLIMLVPVQICRCEGNTLYPMADGQLLKIDQDVTNIEEVIEKITFNLYDAIFDYYCMPTVVVSSMGSQSTGKSYQLNHLGGCLFDVSGGRCTDGCWMTTRLSKDENGNPTLVVFLDFEGLGSWERTEQEDMMLSLMSAAITHLTMFKTHYAFDRYTLQTLKRFNLGAPKVKNMCGETAKNLFTGLFMFCLKDVEQDDDGEDSAAQEFQDKVQKEIQEEDNFLSQMYKGEVAIYSFTPISKIEFYQKLQEVADDTVWDENWLAGKKLQNSRAFRDLLRTLIAKIAHKDWTPIDRTRIRSRVDLLTKHFDNACANGSIKSNSELEDNSPLLNYDSHCEIDVDQHVLVDVSDAIFTDFLKCFDLKDEKSVKIDGDNYFLVFGLEDANIYVGGIEGGGLDCGTVVQTLRNAMHSKLPRQASGFVNSNEEHTLLNRFVEAILYRRKMYIESWITQNMESFIEDPEAKNLQHLHNLHFNTLGQQLQLCSHSCQECYLRCFQTQGHKKEHSCLSNHQCRNPCQFCVTGLIKECGEKAGHPGKHTCGSSEHTCGMKCDLAGSTWNCGEKCQQLPGHTGSHICGTSTHYCNHVCDLRECQEKCCHPFDVQHTLHECSSTGCPIPCLLCNNKCSSSDHFHGSSPGAIHLCDNDHTCVDPSTQAVNVCKHDGWCEIRSELHKEQKTFHGKRGEFQYDHFTNQKVQRHQCVIKIPAGQLQHDGACTHTTDPSVIHYCGEACTACGYRCVKSYGHQGKHATQHGNMRDMNFIADAEDIDLGDRKYACGDSGVAETCDSFCVKLGRGHVHTIPCIPDRCSNVLFSEHRHSQVQYQDGEGNKLVDLDELTHEAYFEYIGFEDPCQPEEQAKFKMCGAKCGSKVHDTDVDADKKPKHTYCDLQLWHEPLKQGDPLPNACTTGYISKNGHFFPCVHNRFSTYFIIDRSGSMGCQDAMPIMPEIISQKKLNNRVGAVYEAAIKYTRYREYSSPDDTVTFVPFGSSAQVVFSGLVVTQQEQILKGMLPHSPAGFTDFVAGFNTAYGALKQERAKNGNQTARKPVFILLTDSGANDYGAAINTVKSIMASEQPSGSSVCIHALGIGSEVDEWFLGQIASSGNGSYYQITGENDVPMGLEVGQVFATLAERPDINVGALTLKK